jgi:hypothetical protein
MSEPMQFRDAIRRFLQAGSPAGVQLVRIVQFSQGNRYTARPVEFDEGGQIRIVGEKVLTVTNLAEPSDAPGELPADTDAVAVDVEGRWVVFVRRSAAPTFPARITGSQGGAAYTVREQVAKTEGGFEDKAGASDLTAHNLAELSLGPGAAVDSDTIVLVTVVGDNGNPPGVRCVFDHPAYAKYLD